MFRKARHEHHPKWFLRHLFFLHRSIEKPDIPQAIRMRISLDSKKNIGDLFKVLTSSPSGITQKLAKKD